MSVKQHEAYCLDAMSQRCDGFDHFWGDSLDARWRTTGTGSAAVVDGVDGGVVRLTTGATTGNDYYIDWSDIRSLHISKKLTMEYRIKLNSTTNVYFEAQLRFDVNNRIRFYRTTGNWLVYTINGGASTNLDGGITPDTDWHIFKIECFPTDEIHYYIDNVETGNSPITTNIPNDAGDYLQPRFYIYTAEDVAKSVDIDYVWWRQDR